MPIFRPGADAYCTVTQGEKKLTVLKAKELEKFNSSVLGLGDIKKESSATDVIAAILDLRGFTNFCKQVDPQLSVPLYLYQFLEWVFSSIRREAIVKEHPPEGVELYYGLPFFAKFIGDGLLFLWETRHMNTLAQHNLIISLEGICRKYSTSLLAKMRREVSEPPDGLRCGVAKGTVYSVGDGNDFVGPCINLAMRLQKLDGAMFAFSRRGLNPEEVWKGDSKVNMEMWILKKVAIRGMGAGELVYLRKNEFEAMNKEDKSRYLEP
jgi:hypothetical protein